MWRPSLFMLRRGKTLERVGDSDIEFTWRFEAFEIGLGFISSVRCVFCGGGISVNGFGESFLLSTASKKALAEAWERWWLVYHNRFHKDAPSSNGFSAGRTIESAKSSAREELIEREVLLQAWQQMRGWQLYKCKTLRAEFINAAIEKLSWNLRYYLLPSESGATVLASVACHPRFGSVFDTCYLNTGAEVKLALSMLRATKLNESLVVPEGWRLPPNASPHDHALFYRDPINNKAFDFLEISSGGAVDLADTSRIETSLLFSESTLPAVARAYHPNYQVLGWGTNSISGINPWPHPLA